MKPSLVNVVLFGSGRSPQGERGLKLSQHRHYGYKIMSLPARGAWVETSCGTTWRTSAASLPARGAWVETRPRRRRHKRQPGRSPQGERGLKLREKDATPAAGGRRSPQGERGLKQVPQRPTLLQGESLPARGAWVETTTRRLALPSPPCRSPQGERGLKHRRRQGGRESQSRSPQGERGLKPPVINEHVCRCRRSPQGERGLKQKHLQR